MQEAGKTDGLMDGLTILYASLWAHKINSKEIDTRKWS